MTLTRRELIAIALIGLLMLAPHLWVRPLEFEPALPSLAKVAPGCVADMLTGVLDCMVVFEDGTFIHKRSY